MVRNFVGVFRGSSAARFAPQGRVEIITSTPVGSVQLAYGTRYSDEGFEDPIPREMWVDARGEAECTLDDAIHAYRMAANMFVPVFSVSANAPASDVDVALGYDATPAIQEHEFFQKHLPDMRDVQHGRDVDAAATTELFQELDRHPDRERLFRACAQYREALEHWKPGRETFAVAHLWMAVEAMTKVAARKAIQDAGCGDEDGLATLWNIDKPRLDGEVRRRLIFHEDGQCGKKTRKASDGFEHGYLTLQEVYDLASEVQERAAEHVRRAIIELIEMPEGQTQVLLGSPYDKVRASWPLMKYMRGRFIGPVDRLAAPGESYPVLDWQRSLTAYRRTADGEEASFSERVQSRSGDGVEFAPDVFEVWGPENDPSPGDANSNA